jgi:aspartate aminotransferase-like enzyme
MLHVGQYVFKQADTPGEFAQIHSLNYRTFVGEIPQHADPGTGRLIDKFHGKNTYQIVLRAGRVVGMVSAHGQPPFSVADRLPDPSILSRPGTRPLEVRLLAIEPGERNSTLFLGLIYALYDYAESNGYTHLFISGFEKRLDMYERIGFEALGPAVPSGNASFVPMVLPVDRLPARMRRVKQQWQAHLERVGKRDNAGEWDDHAPQGERGEVCLLPGPVTIAPAVRAAFHEPPMYHRGPEFIDRFMNVRRTLGAMVGGRSVAILNGSGTLANEAVAATLAATPTRGRGVLLINGEFGQRLAQQAIRFGLRPRHLSWPWGKPWDLDEVAAALAAETEGSWIWGVHLESSTGVLNDLAGLLRVAKSHGVKVCMDCISSLGAVPLDLRDVYLATGATGKSLGAIAGAALLFTGKEAVAQVDRERVPSYFDLAAAMDSEGPCYTFPSATLRALEVALAEYDTPEKARNTYQRYAALGVYVRQELRRLGLEPLAQEDCACPVVTTFAPPSSESASSFVTRCRRWGFAIGGQSSYLAKRRLVQIATMGAVTQDMCAPLFDHLEHWLAGRPALAAV